MNELINKTQSHELLPQPIWLLPTGFCTKQPWPCFNEFQPACCYHLKEAIFKSAADCNEALSKDLADLYLVQSWGTLHSLTGRAAALWVSLIFLLCLCNGIKLGWDNAWVGSQAQRPHPSAQEVGRAQSSALLPSAGPTRAFGPADSRLTAPGRSAVGKCWRRSGHPLGSAGRFAVVSLRGISFSQSHLLCSAAALRCQRLSAFLKRTLAVYCDWFCSRSGDLNSEFTILPLTASDHSYMTDSVLGYWVKIFCVLEFNFIICLNSWFVIIGH